MSFKLFIAEKPSLGRDIAQALGGGESRDGYIEGNGWIVSWVFGHILHTLKPSEVDEKYKAWVPENLPICFDNIPMGVTDDKKKQLYILKDLMEKSSSLVNGGDAGREGQLLIDELLIYFNYQKPVERIWINDTTIEGIAKALTQLRPGEEMKNLSDAAFCRAYADYWVGMTLSPLFTMVLYHRTGKWIVQNTGRVMTPVLYMVVQRDLAIENFKPVNYYEVTARFGSVLSSWVIPDDVLGPEGYLLDKNIAESIVKKIQHEGSGVVSKADYKTAFTPAPMPPILPDLQKEFNRKWGWTAKKTLDIMQSLYMTRKMTTYPRAEQPYLSSSQKKQAKSILEKVSRFMVKPELLSAADFSKNHKVFNDKKLGEHHAIIPTGKDSYSSLTKDEKQAFDYVAQRYFAVFHPDKVTERLSVSIDSADEVFTASFNQVTDPGWDALLNGREADVTPLPKVTSGETLSLQETDVLAKKTKKPAYFTEATLLSAMQNASNFLPAEDAELRSELNSAEGLGTAATRDGFIEKLKRINFIQASGKHIKSTPSGRQAIENSIPEVTSPALTAEWEKMLKQVERGEMTRADFMSTLRQWLTNIVEHFRSQGMLKAKEAYQSKPPSENQLKLAKTIAEAAGVELTDKELEDSFACSKFIDANKKHMPKARVSPPSDKQYAFALKLAQEKKMKIPAAAKKDWKACKTFIDKAMKK